MKKIITIMLTFTLLIASLGLVACGCEHDWEKINTEKQATCFEQGLEEYKCIFCEETEKRVVEIVEHDYTVLLTDSATCTTGGVATFKCTMCDSTQERESLAKGHDYGNADVCNNCDAVKSGYDRFYFNGNVFDVASTFVWNNVTMGIAVDATSGSSSVELNMLLSATYRRNILWSIYIVNATKKSTEVIFNGVSTAGSMTMITRSGSLSNAYDSANKYYIKVVVSNF